MTHYDDEKTTFTLEELNRACLACEERSKKRQASSDYTAGYRTGLLELSTFITTEDWPHLYILKVNGEDSLQGLARDSQTHLVQENARLQQKLDTATLAMNALFAKAELALALLLRYQPVVGQELAVRLEADLQHARQVTVGAEALQ